MSEITFTDEHNRYIWGFARRVERRIKAAGARGIEVEDIYNELVIAWCHARDGWNPNSGAPFLAYLTTGMRRHINRWAEREIGFSGFARTSLDGDSTNGEAAFELHMAVPDGKPDAEEILQAKQVRAKVLPKLTPVTRRFVELFDDPPPELYEAVLESKARAAYAQERGVRNASIPNVTAALVFDLMGLNKIERTRISRELHKVAAQSDARYGR